MAIFIYIKEKTQIKLTFTVIMMIMSILSLVILKLYAKKENVNFYSHQLKFVRHHFKVLLASHFHLPQPHKNCQQVASHIQCMLKYIFRYISDKRPMRWWHMHKWNENKLRLVSMNVNVSVIIIRVRLLLYLEILFKRKYLFERIRLTFFIVRNIFSPLRVS